MNLTIYGRIPSKKNSKKIVCRGRFPLVLPSSDYEKWHKEQSRILLAHGVQKLSSFERIKITLFAPDKRASDLTNKAESIMDLLVDIGVLEDDNWFICKDIHLLLGGVDKERPRAEIEIL